MKRIAWLSDLHLNFLSGGRVYEFLETVRAGGADAILVGGDTGEAHDFPVYLSELADLVRRPIYFVLGNHDCYRRTIAGSRSKARRLCRQSAHLNWLSRSGPVRLTAQTGLVGHDGWADGRAGDYAGSRILLNDYLFIGEFIGLSKADRLGLLHRLGDRAARHLRRVLPAALRSFQRVILLTHAPPFAQASWHQGRLSTDDWLPHMVCQAAGDVLLEVMGRHPDRELTVLCGHTHGAGEARVLDNLRVLTAGADYGAPAIQQTLQVT